MGRPRRLTESQEKELARELLQLRRLYGVSAALLGRIASGRDFRMEEKYRRMHR